MPDAIKVNVNLLDFRKELAELGQRFERRAVRGGVRAAARVFAKLAKQAAPRLKTINARRGRVFGALARAIRVIQSRRATAGRGTVGVFVGFGARKGQVRTARDAFYGRFLELGWYPRGPGRKLKGGVRSRALQRRRNAEAGGRRITGYEFLNPAFQRGQGEAVRVFNESVARAIAREVNRRGAA